MKKLEKNQIEALIDQAIGMMDYSYAPSAPDTCHLSLVLL